MSSSLAVVIVTYNSLNTLKNAITKIIEQTYTVDHVIIVDTAYGDNNNCAISNAISKNIEPLSTKIINTNNDLATYVQNLPIPATYLPSAVNLGGAGGFAYGILHALAKGYEWIWLADDDGEPESKHTLEQLMHLIKKYHLGALSPLVIDINNPDILAFPLRQGMTWHTERRAIQPNNNEVLFGIASLFNGALFRSTTFLDIGVPDLRLFIRGDEVELHRRLYRSTIPFGTAITAAYKHPSGREEFHPILRGKMHAQYPDNANKRYYTYRNRGLLLSQPGMVKFRFQEWLRFTWFFLITRKDYPAYKQWKKLHRLGRQEKFHRHHHSTVNS